MNNIQQKATTIVLVDGDLLLYKILLSSEFLEEKTNKQGETYHSILIEDAKAELVYRLKSIVSDVRKYFKSIDYKLITPLGALGDTNFRKKILRSYKANRKPKPLGYEDLRNHLYNIVKSDKITPHLDACFSFPGIEADDLLGIYATYLEDENTNTVIVSDDKDMLTVPSYNMKLSSISTPEKISKTKAWRNYLIQCLTGDSADNYKGVPGIGKVRAQKIIDQEIQKYCDCILPVEKLYKYYEKAGISKIEARKQFIVARILCKDNVKIDENPHNWVNLGAWLSSLRLPKMDCSTDVPKKRIPKIH